MKKDVKKSAHFWKRFEEGPGFFFLTLICVGVIASTAVWTRHQPAHQPAPTPPVDHARAAAQLLQQSLHDASTPTPLPTEPPLIWHSPLKELTIMTSYDNGHMVYSEAAGIWYTHDAVDLSAETGEIVSAMADGVVVSVEEDQVSGVSVVIRHPEGYEIEYGALSLPSALRQDDPVEAGQTVGFAGSSLLLEGNLPPHLHLRITRNGESVDPMLILRQIEFSK